MADPKIPARIGRLHELAYNLWWSWQDKPRMLFRALDYPLWRLSGHNPVKQLREVSPDTLQKAARDSAFLQLYDSALADFDAYMTAADTWFATTYPDLVGRPVAYFSMEYAIHNSLPIYAGGLGVLAGDLCKEASDLGVPLVAVGFMYPQGYFHQHISADGWQQEIYRQLDFDEAPIARVLSPGGETAVARVELGGVSLAIGVWRVKVGRVSIYLLDTNLPENPVQYRQLTARLYIADRELRMQQEIVLGIGGVRVLRALDIAPAVWHANEGHTAFMMMERVREEVAKGVPFAEAVSHVRAATVFTTHTPVQAGHDIFPMPSVETYFSSFCDTLGIDCAALLHLGRQDNLGTPVLNMTALALRTAGRSCAVSRLHGEVTRRMWHELWPDLPEDRVPISHVTNGVHVPTWIAPELYRIFEKYLGKDWVEQQDDSRLWDRLLDIPDDELWACHQQLKRKLVAAIQERMRNRWVEDNVPWSQMAAMGSLLDVDAMTIVYARRFVEYKRPALIFRDTERLRRIVTNQWHPVQVVFAGKSHPADLPSKHLLHRVFTLAEEREYQGRTAFVEDYDTHMARYLVQGVDLWLNTPRRLQEACGTSGMKASLNGALHLSVLDGWWYEGYNGANGWALGKDVKTTATPEEQDEVDTSDFYRLLEEEIVPLYYDRDRSGVPHGWMRMVKESIRSIVPVFCARRMVKEYTERMYWAAAEPESAAK